MSPLDKQLITRKASLIQEDLDKLEEFADVELAEYEDSLEIRLQVERLLERIVGRVIDINYHILKEKFKVIPRDYHKSFLMLAEKEVIDQDFAQKLAESVGLRNALAHEYDAINNVQVHASIKTCLNQVPTYLDQILNKFS